MGTKTPLFVRKQPGGVFTVVDERQGTGDIWFVDSGRGTDAVGYGRNPDAPFATLDYAIGQAAANNGDLIYVMEGHAETLEAAGAVTVDVAGLTIIGLGRGADRPTFTFDTDTAASILVSAASTVLRNLIGVAAIDGLTNPFHIQAADCVLDVEWRDGSASIEAARAVLTTAAADKLQLRLRYRGFVAGNACVNAIRLVGGDGADIELDAYGVASTAWVEFLTTACTNVRVRGSMYNSGTTDGSKNVVDTATGSTWSADLFDATAGARFSGGSGAALAADDVSTVAGYHTVPSADATANSQMRDVVGNKTDATVTAVGTTKSLMAYLKGAISWLTVATTDGTANASAADVIGAKDDAAVEAVTTNKSLMGYLKAVLNHLSGTAGITTWPAAAAPGDTVSIAEALRYVSEWQVPRLASKNVADLTGYDTAAVFTVTGNVMARAVGAVGATAITSTSGTTTLSLGTTADADALLPATTVDNSDFEIGDAWTDNNPEDDASALSTTGWVVISNGADIVLTRSVDDLTAGELDLYVEWRPLSSDGAVVAA